LKKAGLRGSAFEVYEIIDTTKNKIPSQLDITPEGSGLCWILSGKTPANVTRNYVVSSSSTFGKVDATLQVTDQNGGLTIIRDKHPVLQYVYKTVYPPQGIDTAYRRSGFIHPVWSPAGDTLTNIQPVDHYHHYGIWNPWTLVEYDGKEYDLWNIGDKKGTVRFEKLLDKQEGQVFAGFKVLQGHYIFNNNQAKEIMEETCNIRVWNYAGSYAFLWDFESILHPNTDLPVLLKAYRYAGFSIRATADWTKENCIMFTSEGKERQQIDGSKARWIYLTGTCPKGKAGIMFMSHPDNYNHPEPLRIWDENANYGRGDAFINFAPTKDKDWLLESGKNYKLKYRVFTYDGEISPEKAEQLWIDFAYPLKINILK